MNVIHQTNVNSTIEDPWDSIDASLFEQIADSHGTPYFLYDADAIRQRITRVRDAFAGSAKVYYAVKTNPNLELLKAIDGVADGFDISSGGELEQALAAGIEPATMSFAGPAKTRAELQKSIEVGLGSISVESEYELATIVEIAGQLGKPANIIFRINPKQVIKEFGMKMGGRPIQFGIDEEEVTSIAELVKKQSEQINFLGIHLYVGSQCFETAGIETHVKNSFDIARHIEGTTGLKIQVVNLGGGFGVSHTEFGKELDVEAVGKQVMPDIRKFLDSGDSGRAVIFELGRYLAVDAGIYVARVINEKVSRGKAFFMVDGGLNHHLAAAGVFGAGLRTNYMLKNITTPDAPDERCNIAGPSCNPTDLVGAGVTLPRPRIGDLLGILKSGSYSLTSSPVLFLGRTLPAEIVRMDGKLILGRHPHGILDFN